jgi:hypothetical protein
LIHDLGRVLGIFLADELDKAVPLMCLRDSVFGEMHIDYASNLKHEFPDKSVGDAFVEVADVHGGFFVLLPSIF